MAKKYKVGPATVEMFRIGVAAPGMKAGQGPVAKTTYLSTVRIGEDGVRMMGEGPGSGQEVEMIGRFIETFMDAVSMSRNQFLKTYGINPSVGDPILDFAKQHRHEVFQMQQAHKKGDVVEVN